jgi:hypothetical protein
MLPANSRIVDVRSIELVDNTPIVVVDYIIGKGRKIHSCWMVASTLPELFPLQSRDGLVISENKKILADTTKRQAKKIVGIANKEYYAKTNK